MQSTTKPEAWKRGDNPSTETAQRSPTSTKALRSDNLMIELTCNNNAMRRDASNHYDKKYFHWQQSHGIFGAHANLSKFKGLLDGEYSRILDFGCGGGYLLGKLASNIEKFGVEVNEFARTEATRNGLTCYARSLELPSDYFDLVISDNALEHTENPLEELRELYRSLRPGGTIAIVVPFDRFAFNPNDHNKHLFSWSPMNLGNMLTCAGFKIIYSHEYRHKWVPYQQQFTKLFGWKAFHLASKVWAHLDRSWSQSKALAIKEA